MQREEATVAVGRHRIRLIQRPAHVPPSPPPDAPACATHSQPHQPPHPSDPRAGGSHDQRQPGLRPGARTEVVMSAAAASGSSPAAPPLPLSNCLLGWELWPAAWRLAAYLASAAGEEVLRRAEAVVELGAGLGLPGILAAKAGARAVTLTDLPQALPLLAANVELNGVAGVCRTALLDWAQLAAAAAAASELGLSGGGGGGGGGEGSNKYAPAVGRTARELKGQGRGPTAGAGGWGAGSGGAEEHLGAYDLVLAADVVYVSSLVPLLADTIAAVCRHRAGVNGGGGDSGGGGGAVVLVGHTVRKSVWLDRATGVVRSDPNDEPWEAFVERMTWLHGFRCDRLAGEAAAGGAAVGDGAAAPAAAADTFVCAFKRPS